MAEPRPADRERARSPLEEEGVPGERAPVEPRSAEEAAMRARSDVARPDR